MTDKPGHTDLMISPEAIDAALRDEQWIGYHALDGENSEWTHVNVYRATTTFWWEYYNEHDMIAGRSNGPFTSAWDAYNDAMN